MRFEFQLVCSRLPGFADEARVPPGPGKNGLLPELAEPAELWLVIY